MGDMLLEISEMENQRESVGAELHFLDKYAFNFSRDGYQHQVPQHLTTGTVLRVNGFHQRPTDARPAGDVSLRPPLIPTDEELKPQSSAKGTECIWVGMVPKALLLGENKEESNDEPQAKKARRCGNTADLNETTAAVMAFDPDAIRVVRKKGYKAPTYHAITSLDPQTNLCSGHVIASESVFFFRHFRDDHARSQAARRAACNRKASLAAGISEAASQGLDATGSADTHDARTAAKGTDVAERSTAQKNNDIGEDSSSQIQSPGDNANAGKTANIVNPVDNPSRSQNATPSGNPSDNLNSKSGMPRATDGDLEYSSREGRKEFHASSTDGMSLRASNVDSEHVSESMDGELLPRSSLNTHLSEIMTDSAKNPSSGGSLSSDEVEGYGTKESSVSHDVKSPGKLPIVAGLEVEIYPTGSEDESSDGQSEASTRLVKTLTELIFRFQQHGDVGILEQAVALLKCLEKNRVPADTSALGPSLHVQSKIYEKDCRRKLEEIFCLFPELEKEAGLDENRLAWILKGLQMTGSSIPFVMIQPYIIGFCFEMDKACQAGRNPYRLSRNLLIDMTCAAREHAEAFMQQQASSDSARATASGRGGLKRTWKGVDWRE